MYDVKIKSIKEVNLNAFEFPQVAVYHCPDDYPKRSVGRIFDKGKPTNVVIVATDITDLLNDVMEHTNLSWYARGEEDERAVVGVFT